MITDNGSFFFYHVMVFSVHLDQAPIFRLYPSIFLLLPICWDNSLLGRSLLFEFYVKSISNVFRAYRKQVFGYFWAR